MPISDREIVQLLIAHIETDEGFRPDELPAARRFARMLAPMIARLVRDELAIARRRALISEEI